MIRQKKPQEGSVMARRNRYREFEKKTTLLILADLAVFLLYLLFAGLGVIAMKVITAIIIIIGSLLAIGFLFMSGELLKKRSLWISAAFAGIFLCTVVSLIFNFPAK